MRPGCFFATVDIKAGCRWVPVYPPHRTLQGFCCKRSNPKNLLNVNTRESEYSTFDESENINKSGNISPSVNVA